MNQVEDFWSFFTCQNMKLFNFNDTHKSMKKQKYFRGHKCLKNDLIWIKQVLNYLIWNVRVLSVSRFCPDFPEDPVRYLSAVRISVRCLSVRILSVSILSGGWIFKKTLFVVCLSGRTRARQSFPDFHCPCPPTSGQRSNPVSEIEPDRLFGFLNFYLYG